MRNIVMLFSNSEVDIGIKFYENVKDNRDGYIFEKTRWDTIGVNKKNLEKVLISGTYNIPYFDGYSLPRVAWNETRYLCVNENKYLKDREKYEQLVKKS